MGYISIGCPYTSPGQLQFNQSATKGKQLLAGGMKSKCATQAGYFGKDYVRIFNAESLSDPIKRRRQERVAAGKRNIAKSWVPVYVDKKPSGIGNYYGTIGGPIQHFSPIRSAPPPYKSPGKNILTNPPKRGTGYGYQGVTIGKPYQYQSDPLNRERELEVKNAEEGRKQMKGASFKLGMHPTEYFDTNPFKPDKIESTYEEISKAEGEKKLFKPSHPGKKDGGSHAGTFTAYPTHSEDKYESSMTLPLIKEVMNSSGKKFIPTNGPKLYPIESVVNLNVSKHVTPLNSNQVSTVMFAHEAPV